MDSLKRKERKPDLTSSQVYSLEMWDQLWLREESLRSKIGWCKVAEASFATERNLDKEYFLYTTPRLLSPAFAWRPSIRDAHSLQFTQTTQLIQIQRIFASGFRLSFEFFETSICNRISSHILLVSIHIQHTQNAEQNRNVFIRTDFTSFTPDVFLSFWNPLRDAMRWPFGYTVSACVYTFLAYSKCRTK